MYVFELTYPGTWLDHPDRDLAWKIEGLLRMIESQFTDAAVALNLFEHARSQPPRHPTEDMRDPEYANRRRELEDRILSKEGSRAPWEATREEQEEARYQTEVELQKAKWRNGVWPYGYEFRLPFLYARAFLLSMDMIKKMMVVLAKDTPGVPSNVKSQVDKFEAHFPRLKGVRDTEQHLEDRGRGLRKDKKPLNLQPMNNSLVSAPSGGVLVLGNLNGNRYGNTTNDGSYGEVEVSANSLSKTQECIQGILDSFYWSGPKKHYPQ